MNLILSKELPEWVGIYYAAQLERDTMRCNLCEIELHCDSKSHELLEHIKDSHKDVHDLHKDNPEATVGFRVEFLHLNVLKDEDGNTKNQPLILGEVCEAGSELVTVEEVQEQVQDQDSEVINMQYVMLDAKRKNRGTGGNENRRRSWIWKYFDRLSNIVYRCNLCNVVLSIKGCNTNNLNRHIKSKHPDTFQMEKSGDGEFKDDMKELSGGETPFAIKTEEIYASNSSLSSSSQFSTSPQKLRRSWIWSYFDHVSPTSAQCKLCKRQINHGGNATGNMNRHLKMVHYKTAICENDWVWKVFGREAKAYTCKICQLKLSKNNSDSDLIAIMHHLKEEHGVVSGDQIITGSDCDTILEN